MDIGFKTSRSRTGIAAISLVVAAAAIWAIASFAWSDPNLATEQDALKNLDGREYLIKCKACGGEYKMSAKAYLLQVQARDVNSDDGIPCALCGAHAAWREYGVRHWNDLADAMDENGNPRPDAERPVEQRDLASSADPAGDVTP